MPSDFDKRLAHAHLENVVKYVMRAHYYYCVGNSHEVKKAVESAIYHIELFGQIHSNE